VRNDVKGRRRSALVAALLLLSAACTKPTSTVPAASPTPSPLPTPTAPLMATSEPFHAGEVGVVYAPVALSATGGLQPYTWTISEGALPDGLALGGSASVSGTPRRGGGFSFTVQAADAGGSSAALPATIAIAAAPSASLIPAFARYCSVEVGCVDVCGNFGALSGGTGPFTYAVQPGGLVPVGTHLNGFSLAGTFSQRAQFWQFTVVVTDALGQTASVTPTFYVFPHISFSGSTLCKGGYNTACSASVPYSGGTPSGTPAATVVGFAQDCPSPTFCYPTPRSLPPGFTMSVGGGNVTVRVPADCGGSATGGCPNGWGVIVKVNLTDQSLCASATNCTSPGAAAFSIEMACG